MALKKLKNPHHKTNNQNYNMKPHKPLSPLLLILLLFSHSALAEDKKLADKLLKGSSLAGTKISSCNADFSIFCSDFSHNSQKAYVCLMEHENSLSNQCKLGILEASITLKKQILAINHSVKACEANADAYCLHVTPGEWRIVSCLKKTCIKVG